MRKFNTEMTKQLTKSIKGRPLNSETADNLTLR